jgi:hypothetical protein
LVSGVESLKGLNSRNQVGKGIGIIGEVYSLVDKKLVTLVDNLPKAASK